MNCVCGWRGDPIQAIGDVYEPLCPKCGQAVTDKDTLLFNLRRQLVAAKQQVRLGRQTASRIERQIKGLEAQP